MSWRDLSRRLLPYLVATLSGFLAAYLIVAFVIFPAGIIPQDKPVPNVTGLSYEEAAKQLDRAGFSAQQGEARFNAMAPQGTVLEQEPAPGARELRGSTVTLTVSGGARFAVVPQVAGLPQHQAEDEIAKVGLTVGEVSVRPSSYPRGQVLDTRPTGGSQVMSGSQVALVLSAGPDEIEVPDVVGRSTGEARTLLEQLGLRVGQIRQDPDASAAQGLVTQQSPEAGTRQRAGAPVDLTVSARAP